MCTALCDMDGHIKITGAFVVVAGLHRAKLTSSSGRTPPSSSAKGDRSRIVRVPGANCNKEGSSSLVKSSTGTAGRANRGVSNAGGKTAVTAPNTDVKTGGGTGVDENDRTAILMTHTHQVE